MLIEKRVLRFLALAAGLYICWFAAYEYLLKPDGRLDHIITVNVTQGICALLRLTGYDAYYSIALKLGETYIYLKSSLYPVIRVGASCNGLELLVLFVIFVLCYPGRWLVKIPFSVIGVLLIHGLNILRNYWLTLMAIHQSPWYNLFHRYVFIFMVYGAIFYLWILWANTFSHLKLSRESKK